MTTDITKQVTDINKSIVIFKDYNAMLKVKLDNFIAMQNTIGVLTTVDKRNMLNGELKAVKTTIKDYKDLRLSVTRVLDEIKSNIMEHEKENIADLENAKNNVIKVIATFDLKAEEDRKAKIKEEQDKLAAQEAIRQAKEKRRNELSENLNKIDQLLASIPTIVIQEEYLQTKTKFVAIKLFSTQNTAYLLEFDFTERMNNQIIDINEALSYVPEAITKYNDLLLKDKKKAKALQKQNEIDKKSLEAQFEEEQKERLINEAKAEQEEYDKQLEREENIEKLKKEKLKNLNLGFDLEIENIDLVPDEFIKKDLKVREAKKHVKAGNIIPGLKIKMKDGTYLENINIL